MYLNRLVHFLKNHFPNDLLMPTKEGTKHPMFPHKNGAWSWEKFDEYHKKHPNLTNVCIILNDLCVIDIDTDLLVEKYESLYPEITECPTEVTAKGKHYWFIRPKNADAHGYYDGAAQREPGVDFKSVCASGTGGIVVVAPSTGKSWLRQLWTTKIVEIPHHLLNAVAVPRHKYIKVILKFEDMAEPVVVENRWISMMTYINDATELFGTDAVLHVPCTKTSFDNLVATLDNNDLVLPTPSKQLLQDMVRAADILGLPERLVNTLLVGVPRMHLDIHDKCPSWWRAMYSEKLWLINGAKDEDILSYVPSELKLGLPIEKDERFLFPRNVHSYNGPPGTNLIKPTIDIPEKIAQILRKYPGKVILAGGRALSTMVQGVAEGEDFDLFMVGVDANEATTKLNEIRASLNAHRVGISKNAVTFFISSNIMVQVVLRLYQNIAQVLVGFDLHPCKVGIYSEDGCALVAKCTPTWMATITKMAFPVDLTNWSRASAIRIIKYMSKGFDVFVPGLRRSAQFFPSKSSSTDGLKTLMWCEYYISTLSRATMHRVTKKDVEMCAREVYNCYNSDYSLAMKLQGRMRHVLENLFAWVRSFVMDVHPYAMATEYDKDYLWTTCELRNNVLTTTFNPCNLRLRSTLCANTLKKIFMDE